jgi:hypothetical protein
VSSGSTRLLSRRLKLKIEPNPNEDLAEDLELTAEPISGDLEAYPESNDETDKLLASLKRERLIEKDGSRFPFGVCN